jgi:hypothetical protein
MEHWESADTFEKIQKLNILFLKGVIKSTPYHAGPIDYETESMLKRLIKINKLGLLTFDSQPNVICDRYRQKSDIWFIADIKQIEYLYNFIIPYKKYGLYVPAMYPSYSNICFENETSAVNIDGVWHPSYDYSLDFRINATDIFKNIKNRYVCIIFKNIYTGKNVDHILYRAIKSMD